MPDSMKKKPFRRGGVKIDKNSQEFKARKRAAEKGHPLSTTWAETNQVPCNFKAVTDFAKARMSIVSRWACCRIFVSAQVVLMWRYLAPL